MSSLEHLFENNLAWASEIKRTDPGFFSRLSKQQTPDYLWIGCSDSRVPANQIIDLPPGDVFVHRNIANVVVHSDLNCLSVLQYSVEMLKVKHIIVCGHYGCGGVQAAMEDTEHGLIDSWLRHIKDVGRFNADELNGLQPGTKLDRLCELNVIEQVSNVCNSSVVKKAWRDGVKLAVHGWIYSIQDGIVRDLKTSISSLQQLQDRNNGRHAGM